MGTTPPQLRGADTLFAGDSVMAARMRAHDWAATRLGPPELWPSSLRTVVRIMLTSRFAMWMGWGPDLLFFYNDAYLPTLGVKHDWALAEPARKVWQEIWPAIGPRVEAVMQRGEATWDQALRLFLERSGYVEETYHTFSYSPIQEGSGQTRGMLCVVTEETERVIWERRLSLLQALSSRLGACSTSEQVFSAVARCLETSAPDTPFSIAYVFEDGGERARLAAMSGFRGPHPTAPESLEVAPGALWPLDEMRGGNAAMRIIALPATLQWPGPWGKPCTHAWVVPIAQQGQSQPLGALIVGASPYRPMDESYGDFIGLVVGQISAALASARAYEEERRRAEALAEVDRAKTAFFSNVSHEFRTPLTLLLGPLTDLLSQSRLSDPERMQLELMQRNAMRLLKLVNTLLEFSRIEAGRVVAAYEPTDLAGLTIDLASAFRSAIDRAGLTLEVDCEPIGEPVYVDPEMWEKIVLNLISNAFKFTFEGTISVSTRRLGQSAQLIVRDSGCGIPQHELPHVFKRFHRVQGTTGRTHEGTGIGLALVQDLVRLHCGTVQVESKVGRGSTFTVTLPLGHAHLPASNASQAPRTTRDGAVSSAFVQEALRWLPDAVSKSEAQPSSAESPASASPTPAAVQRSRVLLVDDNADMRLYLRRLIGSKWEVETASDGAEALAMARADCPDLIVTDVMMPKLDGFGLLEALRADLRTKQVPVIVLSARAGEEARVQGLQAGASDYLVKPFTARELIARIETQLLRGRLRSLEIAESRRLADEVTELARARREAEIANRAKDEFLAMLGHELRNPLAPILTALQLMSLKGIDAAQKEREVIERQVSHLTGLVNDLLDISRITRGKVQLRLERVEIAEAVTRGVELASPLLEQHRHGLSIDVPRDGLIVLGDPARLAQIVANLVSNAAKYTKPGGRITVTGQRAGESIVLSVRDTGIGIAKEMLPQVFEPFAQEHQALDRSQGGLGLGLAIVRSFVALHGGSVAVHSDGQGCGSEFTVTLPQAPATSMDALEPVARTPMLRVGAPATRVLIVDDNEDAATMLADILGMKGYVTRCAHDAPSALRVAQELEPDVAVLDIGLPVMDGFELARRFSEHPRLRKTRLIAVTGYGQEQDRMRSAAAGFAAHLIKPVDLEALQVALEGVARAPTPGSRDNGAPAL